MTDGEKQIQKKDSDGQKRDSPGMKDQFINISGGEPCMVVAPFYDGGFSPQILHRRGPRALIHSPINPKKGR